MRRALLRWWRGLWDRGWPEPPTREETDARAAAFERETRTCGFAEGV